MEYIAIIGAITPSTMNERDTWKGKLQQTLNIINDQYKDAIAANFLITVKNEFQGLLLNTTYLFDMIRKIQLDLYPIHVKIGIGLGTISTDINREAAIGADGPAYYAAREMIESLKQNDLKYKAVQCNVRIGRYQDSSLTLDMINQLFDCLFNIEQKWSSKQRATINYMLLSNTSQRECAFHFGTTQSTISRRLQTGDYYLYQKIISTLSRALTFIELR